MLTETNKLAGFTIIEILMVLALAGLITSLVFLSVAQSQKAARDTARKDSVNRYATILKQIGGNANGVYPTACGGPGFLSGCQLDGWAPPGNLPLTVSIGTAPSASTSSIVWNATVANTDAAAGWTNCSGEVSNGSGGTNHIVDGAVDILLESGSTYCVSY